ncbi:hypothetical protein MMC30_004366 [Trapelia coarctata]|nr:hypothetical protein [Trapelia coarctata]
MAPPAENPKKRLSKAPSPERPNKKPCLVLQKEDYGVILLDTLISSTSNSTQPGSDIEVVLPDLQDLTKLFERKVASLSVDHTRPVPSLAGHSNSADPSLRDVLLELRSQWNGHFRCFYSYMESPERQIPPPFVYQSLVFGHNISSQRGAGTGGAEVASTTGLPSSLERAFVPYGLRPSPNPKPDVKDLDMETDMDGDSTSANDHCTRETDNGQRKGYYTISSLCAMMHSIASKATALLPSEKVGLAIFSTAKLQAMYSEGYRLWRLSDVVNFRIRNPNLKCPLFDTGKSNEAVDAQSYFSPNNLPMDAFVSFIPWDTIKEAAFFPDHYFLFFTSGPTRPISYFVHPSEYVLRAAALVRILMDGMHQDCDLMLLTNHLADTLSHHGKWRYSVLNDSGALCANVPPDQMHKAFTAAVFRSYLRKFYGSPNELLKWRLNMGQSNVENVHQSNFNMTR